MRPVSKFPANYVTCRCPSCFEEICIGDCAILSAIDGSTIKPRPIPTRPEERDYASINPEPLVGDYVRKRAQRQCYECGYLLPSNIERVPSYTIAVIGDTFSGKSHFIAALLYQWYHWMNQLHRYRAQLLCLTPEKEKEYKSNLSLLFGTQQRLGTTVQATGDIQPLIYQLSIENNSFLKKEIKMCNIMIYDTAGEDFANINRLVTYGKFVLHADAFIFVVDPVPIGPIFQDLDPSRLPNYPELQVNYSSGRRPVEIVKSVMEIIKDYRYPIDAPTRHPLSDVPIAIMVSKADLLRYLVPPYDLKSFTKSPTYSIKVDLEDINLVDQDVRSMLYHYGQGDLFATINFVKNVHFFASTATSQPPDTQGKFSYVQPYRCLDPLLWIFHQLGVLGRV